MCPSNRRYGERSEDPLRPAFNLLDVDGDGRIGREDLKSFFHAASGEAAAAPPPDKEEALIRSMIAAADADRDGYVAFDEFERMLPRRRRLGGGAEGTLEKVFSVMDRDGDGEVGFEDLRGYMNWAGLPASDEDLMAMISLAGGGGGSGGGVCFESFVKMFAVDLA